MTPSCTSILKIAEPKLAKGENVPEWATIRIIELEPGEESESETNIAADDRPGDSALPGRRKGKKLPVLVRGERLQGLFQNAAVLLPRPAGGSRPPHLGGQLRRRRLSKSPLFVRALGSSRRKHAHHWKHFSGSRQRCSQVYFVCWCLK